MPEPSQPPSLEDEISLLSGLRSGVPLSKSGPALGLALEDVERLCEAWREQGIYRWVAGGSPLVGWLVDKSLSGDGQ